MIEVKDEVLVGEPQYRIVDKNRNIINDEVFIEMITKVEQEGTPLNKVLFDKINLLGAHKEVQQYVSQTTELSSGDDTWEEVKKGEEAVFQLPKKRFLILTIKYLSYKRYKDTMRNEAKTIYSPATFILDTVEKNAYSLTTNTLLFEGQDFTDLPNGYKICKEIPDIGIGFALKNIENNMLKIQPFVYNNSNNSSDGYTTEYSILIELHEFLSYKEVQNVLFN